MTIRICVGSSCHLKGSEQIVELMQNKIKEYNLENEINLIGSFCLEHCNRIGVSISVDDKVYSGVTTSEFDEFFQTNILNVLKRG